MCELFNVFIGNMILLEKKGLPELDNKITEALWYSVSGKNITKSFRSLRYNEQLFWDGDGGEGSKECTARIYQTRCILPGEA